MGMSSQPVRHELGQVAKEMEQMLEAGLKTSADHEKYDKLMTRSKDLCAERDRIDALNKLTADFGRTAPPPNGQPGGEFRNENEGDRQYRTAFDRYLRAGRAELTAEERSILRSDRGSELRAMGTGGEGAYPGASAGFFAPVGFVRQIESAMKYFGPMLAGDGTGRDGLPTIMDTDTGAPLPWPTDNDTAVTGERIGENQPVNTADVSVGMINFGAYKYSSKLVKVSLELLQDSAFDLESWLAMKFGERTGRIVNTECTVGTGSGDDMPQGIVTAAALAGTAVGSAGNDGSGGANTIGSDDLVTLEHSVDPAYRRGAGYMLHDTTIAAFKKIKDQNGRPIWQPGLAAGAPDTINGYPYFANNDMDQLQSATGNSPVQTKKTLLFGQLSKYTIRRVRQMSVMRLSERFADYGQVAFLLFSRYDGKLLDAGTNPVKYLRNVT